MQDFDLLTNIKQEHCRISVYQYKLRTLQDFSLPTNTKQEHCRISVYYNTNKHKIKTLQDLGLPTNTKQDIAGFWFTNKYSMKAGTLQCPIDKEDTRTISYIIESSIRSILKNATEEIESQSAK